MKFSSLRLAMTLAMVATLLGSSIAMAQRPGGGNRPGGGFGGGGPGGGFGGFGGGGGSGSTLGLLLRESNAEELKLTDEQKTKIREISEKLREDTRIRDIGGKMRDASEEERAVLQADIVKIVEEQRKQSDGELKQLLSAEQFTRYRQMAIRSRGVGALSDSDIAGELKLSEEQIAKLKTVTEENDKRRRELMDKMRESGGRGNFDEIRTKFEELRKESEEKRLSVLTDAQREQWTTMKGPEPVVEGSAVRPTGSGESTSRPARPTAPIQNLDAVGSQSIGDDKSRKPVVSFGKSADEYAAAKSAALTAEKPADGDAATTEPPKPEKISFNFRHAPWADVLKTFSELAGLTLDLNVVPPGTFNYFDDKEYTATEALDVINGYLLSKGYVLVRRDQFLVVINIDDKVPPNLVPHVKVSDLPNRGRNELMNIILRIENITAEEAAAEATELIGPQGSVVALKRSSSISVTDIGSNLQRIHELLIGLNAAPTDLSFKSFELKHIDAFEAEDKVRAIFGLPRGVESVAEGSRSRSSSSYDYRSSESRDRDGRPIVPVPTTTKPKVQVSSDERTNQLLVTANAPELKIIDELLKTIDVEELPGAVRRPRSREPYLNVYSAKTADVQEVAKTLNVLYPGCVVNEDGRTRRLHIFATPVQHEQIERTIRQLDGEGINGGISVAVVPTGRIDSLTAVATLQTLFAAERESAPSMTPHPTGYGLIVRGSADQVSQIKLLIAQMDPKALTGEPQKGNVRSIPLDGRDPDEFSRMLKQYWGQKNSTPIIIVPSNFQPIQDQRVPSAAPNSNEPAPSRESTRPPRAASRPKAEIPLDKPTSTKRKVPKIEAVPMTQPRAQSTQATIFTVSLLEETNNKAAEPATPATTNKAKKKTTNPNKSKKAARKAQAAPNAATAPRSVESATDTPATDENGEPIRVFSNGGNLVITGKDETALDDMERLIELMLDATPSKPRWTIFYLRSADASETAAMLERLFPSSSVSASSSSSSGMLGELTGGISSMSRSLMNATGLSSAMTNSLTLRIIPDLRANALYVAGPADQIREVEAMLRVLDASELPDQLRDRSPHRILVKHAEVEDVAAIVRDIYKDDMSPEGQQQGQQQNPFAMLMGGGGGSSRGGSSRGGQQGARTIKLTLSVDSRTNTLIVSSSESLFRQIEALVQSIDEDARAANHTVRVVDIKGSNSAAVQSALTAMYSKIKTASTARSSSSSSRGSSSSSSGSSTPSSSSGGFPPGMPFMPPFGGGFPGGFGGDRGSSGSSGSSSSSRYGGSPFGGSSSGGSPFGSSRGSGR